MYFSAYWRVEFNEWAWLVGFAIISLALVALAVLIDGLYEGYRQRKRQLRQHTASPTDAGAHVMRKPSDQQDRKAA